MTVTGIISAIFIGIVVGALGQLDAGHTARSTTLRAHVLRLKGQ